jgi:hypothetical protein
MLRIGSFASIMVALVVLGTSGAQSTNHDGRWSVVFVSQQGGCQQREIEISVQAGQITHAGFQVLFTTSGHINELGQVDASIAALGHTATAKGQLAGASGSGTWSMPEFGCSGQWTARRL